MTEKEYQYISVIAECGNITKAAEKLFIAQPSLTQSLHRIEQDYGTAFFYRGREGVRLTGAGEAYMTAARQMLQVYRQMKQEICSDRTGEIIRTDSGKAPMNTLQLNYFMEFALCGSAKRVAAQMGVSRSSVSRNIKKLEESVAASLFTQTVHGICLTREGNICLEYARRVMKIDDNLRFDIAGAGEYRGKIDIAMGTSRSQDILMFVLPEFNRRYPNVSVQIHEMCTNDIYSRLLGQWLDFAIVSRTEVPQGITYEHLMTERLVLVAPRDDAFVLQCLYEKEGKVYVDLRRFRDQSFILGYSTQKSRTVSDRLFRRVGFEPRIILRTSNNFNAAMLAYNGLAYTLVPESSAVREKNYMPHYHLEPEEVASWSIGIASLDKNPVSHAGRQLQQLIREMLGDQKNQENQKE